MQQLITRTKCQYLALKLRCAATICGTQQEEVVLDVIA